MRNNTTSERTLCGELLFSLNLLLNSSESHRKQHFRPFPNFDKYRLEVASDDVFGNDVEQVKVNVSTNLINYRSAMFI